MNSAHRVLSGFCLLLAPVWAQSISTSQIKGTIQDPTGAPIAGAEVKVTQTATAASRTTTTGPDGGYLFPELPVGPYRLEASKEGFSRAVQTGIVLQVASNPTIDVTLKVGAVSESIEVQANAALVETQTNAVGQVVDQQRVVDLPLNGRNFTDLSWDLIPRIAIADVSLVPGSNPLFGLNSLGGAVSIETKDGRSQPGTSIQVYGGSFGRRAVEFEQGGSISKGLNWYVAGNLLHDDGWRVKSPSDVRQAFSKLGWQGVKTTVSLSFGYADNYLTGNGLQEQRFLVKDYASGYTYGDTTTNRSPFFNLSARHAASSTLTFSGNAYFRYIRADSVTPISTPTRSMNLFTSRPPLIRRRLQQPDILASRRAVRMHPIPRFLIGAVSLRAFSSRNPSKSATG